MLSRTFSRLSLALLVAFAFLSIPRATYGQDPVKTVTVHVVNNNSCTTRVRVVQDNLYLGTLRLDAHETVKRTVIVKNGLPVTFEVATSVCDESTRYTVGPLYPNRPAVTLTVASIAAHSYLQY